MTARRTANALTLCVGLALVVVACTSAAGTASPTGIVTEAPATEAASTQAAGFSELPAFSFALPSFTADAELESKFPKDLGGEAVIVRSMSGTDFLKTGATGNAISPVLDQLGKTPADLSVAFGGTMDVVVNAIRIEGVPADQFLTAFKTAAQAGQGSTVTQVSFGGKSVQKVAAAGQNPVYLYLNGDIVWTVGGVGSANPTDALLNEAFSKLP